MVPRRMREGRMRGFFISPPFVWSVTLLITIALSDCRGVRRELPGRRKTDVPFVTTPPAVVSAMLRLARLRPGELLYDLGCGDGNIAITAARDFGARAVCVDMDRHLIERARRRARVAGVEKRIRFVTGNLFEVDLRDADVVAFFLSTRVNRWLLPKFKKQLRPGTRLVSHGFGIDGWPEDRQIIHQKARNRTIYFWVVRAR